MLVGQSLPSSNYTNAMQLTSLIPTYISFSDALSRSPFPIPCNHVARRRRATIWPHLAAERSQQVVTQSAFFHLVLRCGEKIIINGQSSE